MEIALTRARRELKFFSKIAELAELAGAKLEDAHKVEADAAWQFANRYLQRYGVVKYDPDNRPPLLPPVDYALRPIAGLGGLNHVTTDSYPFKYKDFCQAYKQWTVAEILRRQTAGLASKQRQGVCGERGSQPGMNSQWLLHNQACVNSLNLADGAEEKGTFQRKSL